jgi:hypothetical protein
MNRHKNHYISPSASYRVVLTVTLSVCGNGNFLAHLFDSCSQLDHSVELLGPTQRPYIPPSAYMMLRLINIDCGGSGWLRNTFSFGSGRPHASTR